ncbi:glycosyltransferase family 4 protein [Mixia osmundae IAM 14324]|uniref:Glycosyltransferase subfamily 4-like N-terminal domain-containing protein n=1 Tax=Mixia osmundae (strain CBS 9802 / IAM 14324 / JCM 22182 / KY 12970) TaxID=764103 RepID=G7E261_MIXOS|nr:glycosyltransferase family 4 protein [Mixia osmundae IAM 14324]KEI36793.1 glycosyltransferase family 4 protein [Mixia osmundae IAM 14324]GAA96921.1 hypothetical protein E5Q_03595 [Mixia osmundae IAM 14324]
MIAGTETPPLFSLDGDYVPSPPASSSKPSARSQADAPQIAGKAGPLRIAIITENFLPKVDGVTRTLARLLEHLRNEGHEAIVLGPESGLTHYAGHEVCGTRGVPLLIYPGLKLNFFRPLFVRRLLEFKPDVIHCVDPIFLGAQTLPAVEQFLPEVGLVSSYHTNLAMYASMFGFSWLTSTMWKLKRTLHGKCAITFCPSPSTARMLATHDFQNLRIWSRGVDNTLFSPAQRSDELRASWGVKQRDLSANDEFALPPPYLADGLADAGIDRESVVILYVGRLSWEKNLRLLVEAFKTIVESASDAMPHCKLVFVGDGPARSDMAALCKQYGLDAHFTGHKSGAALSACFASADIFAFPSASETFGQVVLEALSSGLPVVGLQAEGVCDLVTHGSTGLLLDLNRLVPNDAESIAKYRPQRSPILPPYDAKAAQTFQTLDIPNNVHELLDANSATFPTAVQLYAGLIQDLVASRPRRQAMSRAALEAASKHTWWEAMDKIVQGYRQVAFAAQQRQWEKVLEESFLAAMAEDEPKQTSKALKKLFSPTGLSAKVAIASGSSPRQVSKVFRLGQTVQRQRVRQASKTDDDDLTWTQRKPILSAIKRIQQRHALKAGTAMSTDSNLAAIEGNAAFADELLAMRAPTRQRVLYAMRSNLLARLLVMILTLHTVWTWASSGGAGPLSLV